MWRGPGSIPAVQWRTSRSWPSASFNANINTTNARDNRTLGPMMVSMWNAPGDRVQTVRAPAQLAQVASRLPHGEAATQRELAFSPGGNAFESRRGLIWNGTSDDYAGIFRFSTAITQERGSEDQRHRHDQQSLDQRQ